MHRRDFLRAAGFATAGFALRRTAPARAAASPPDGWRTFDVTTRVEILKPSGTTRVWLPAALPHDTPYQRTHTNDFHVDEGSATLLQTPADGLAIVAATFPPDTKPVLTLTSRIATRDHAVDLTMPRRRPKADAAELAHFRRATALVPTDGVVRDTARAITRGAKTDVAKARAIYEWVIDNTYRDPQTRGCGSGDVRALFAAQTLGGKCADLHALFVGLARAAGLPSRDVYGLRVAKSELGYKSLGPATTNVTKAQHCRAEVFLDAYGWVPVDPADVRKVVLEEPPGNRPIDDAMVERARTRLFGSWEMNWMAYNFASDVTLPGSRSGPVAYLMYPEAETDDGRLDCLDPDHFKYEITATETTGLA